MPNSITIVEVINLSQKSCKHMNTNYRIPLSRNYSRMGKANPGILCQWTPQCSLEAVMKTQVTDTWLVKSGGVHHTVTPSLNGPLTCRISPQDDGLENLDRCSGEHFGQVPVGQAFTQQRLSQICPHSSRLSCLSLTTRSSVASELKLPRRILTYLQERIKLIILSVLRLNANPVVD